MLESHSHAPVATAEEFAADCDLAGDALAADWRAPHPRGPLTFAGFAAAMDAHGPWQALPLRHAQVDASGPVEQAFFDAFVDALCTRLRAAMPVDGVFLSLHGAAIATGDPDPDGTVLERVRGIVGPDVPVVATLDLHANVVQRMVDHADVLIAYRENPHTDLAARGADCAAALREMLAGMRPARAFVKLPFVPPSVAQNTASGPYRALIEHGQALRGPGVLDVSVLSGFTLGDTPKNGLSVIVTTRGDPALARAIAIEVARHAWEGRHAWVPRLASIADATARALACGRDPRDGLRSPRPECLKDVVKLTSDATLHRSKTRFVLIVRTQLRTARGTHLEGRVAARGRQPETESRPVLRLAGQCP